MISDEAVDLLRARASRSTSGENSHGIVTSLLWRGKVTGWMAGCLFLRSLDRSERVYFAMLSRGYAGIPPSIETKNLAKKDKQIIGFGLTILILIWIFGLIAGG